MSGWGCHRTWHTGGRKEGLGQENRLNLLGFLRLSFGVWSGDIFAPKNFERKTFKTGCGTYLSPSLFWVSTELVSLLDILQSGQDYGENDDFELFIWILLKSKIFLDHFLPGTKNSFELDQQHCHNTLCFTTPPTTPQLHRHSKKNILNNQYTPIPFVLHLSKIFYKNINFKNKFQKRKYLFYKT